MDRDWRKDAEGSDFVKIPFRDQTEETICLIFENRDPTPAKDNWDKDVWDWPVKLVENVDQGRVVLSGSRLLRVRSKRQLRLLAELFDLYKKNAVKESGRELWITFTFWRLGVGMNVTHHGQAGPWHVDIENGSAKALASTSLPIEEGQVSE